MDTRGAACAVVVMVGLGCVAAGCGASSSQTSTASSTSAAGGSPQRRSRFLVALGDSVPHGTNCNCTPYPPLTGSGLSAKSGQTVTAANDAVSGYTTSDVLQQLQSDTAVIDHVRTADAVEIEVGANDVAHSRSCGTNAGCYASKIPAIQTNLDAIVGRVHELTSGHKVLVVLLDYWSVWLGGQYAAAQGAAYDETHYLSNDGDHPNAAGHQQIATATEAVIESALHS